MLRRLSKLTVTGIGMLVMSAAASAAPVALYSTGFDLVEGYTLGTAQDPGQTNSKTPHLKGQVGWVQNDVGPNYYTYYANSWVSDDGGPGPSYTPPPANNAFSPSMTFDGTGYAHMMQSASAADIHPLDASGVGVGDSIASITVEFDMAFMPFNNSSNDRKSEISLGTMAAPFYLMKASYNYSGNSRKYSRLFQPDGATVWSGGWDGSNRLAGGSWAWQDRVRAHFVFTITDTQVQGSFTVLDSSQFYNSELSNDSFTYTLPTTLTQADLKALAGSNIIFKTTSSGDPSSYMIDNLSVKASVVPEPASLALPVLGGLAMFWRKHP